MTSTALQFKRPLLPALGASFGVHGFLLILVYFLSPLSSLKTDQPSEIIFLNIGASSAPPALSSQQDFSSEKNISLSSDVPLPSTQSTAPSAPVEPVATQQGPKELTTTSSDGLAGASSGSLPNEMLLSLKQQYILEIRRILESKKEYPRVAKRLGQSGIVLLQIEVSPDGQIHERKIVDPSRYDQLNAAAYKLVASLEKLPPFSKKLGISTWEIQVPVEYELR